MPEMSTSKGCEYSQIENGIHLFVFHDASKVVIDEFFQQLEQILAGSDKNDIARYIIDITQSGEQEVSLVANTQRFRRLETLYPNRARGRTVILHKPGLKYSFIDAFIRALAPNRDITRFFEVAKRDEAIQWLLSQK
ncbi:MAG: hypothetical protein R3E39_13575 [Anaerolineae bacterium]